MAENGFSDKLKGNINKAKGEIKDQVGNAANDASLQAKGKMDKLKGQAQEKLGEMKDKYSDKK